MVRVKTEFWMWLGKELGPEFESPTDMRANLQSEVEEGITVRQFLDRLAERYPLIRERVFPDHQLGQYVVATLNHRGMDREDLYRQLLRDGDVITVLPIYVGG
ncbi:MAG: MoaD/ThiS family protein [Chloroflexota bacterium]